MPSDERIAQLLQLIAPAVERYRAAMRIAADQMRSWLAASHSSSDQFVERAEAELGEFGVGKINASRFAALFLRPHGPAKEQVVAAERALAVLDGLLTLDESLFLAEMKAGDDLRATVHHAIAHAGRAFGAARVFELARTNRYEPRIHDQMLEGFPFRMWNRAERQLAPSFIFSVDGADFVPVSLADTIDGAIKLIFVLRGTSAPAPLARLVTPATFVMQTTQIADVSIALSSPAPAIAAIVPAAAVQFVHDPAAPQKLVVRERPKTAPRHSIGGMSVAQQLEDLRLLDVLAAAPSSAAEASIPSQPAAAVDPVEKLAAWLLQQAKSEVVSTEV